MAPGRDDSELFCEFEHTGDIGIEVVAASKAELFRRAAIAVGRLMVDTRDVKASAMRQVSVANADDAELLHDALSEVTAVLLSDGFIWSDAAATCVDGELELHLFGEKFDPARHPLRQEIKAVTYHQLSVSRSGGNWRARVIFDV